VAVGEGVSHAMRIRVDELPAKFQPKSVDSSFTSAWQSDSKNRSFVQMIIQRWRQQSY
jgi:hypothetical protein